MSDPSSSSSVHALSLPLEWDSLLFLSTTQSPTSSSCYHQLAIGQMKGRRTHHKYQWRRKGKMRISVRMVQWIEREKEEERRLEWMNKCSMIDVHVFHYFSSSQEDENFVPSLWYFQAANPLPVNFLFHSSLVNRIEEWMRQEGSAIPYHPLSHFIASLFPLFSKWSKK